MRFSVFATLALLFLGAPADATAATFTVTNLADSGTGSLRQAILDSNAAAGADEVSFASGLAGTITLTSGEMVISDPLLVNGPGNTVITVSGDDRFRIFYVENAALAVPIDVTLSGLTLTHGLSFPVHTYAFGGAVFAFGENLTIRDCVISDGIAGLLAAPAAGACGGNVASYGTGEQTLRVTNSLLTRGDAAGQGGGVGGNLCAGFVRLLLEGSILSGGSVGESGSGGGGLFLQTAASDNSIVLSTIANNSGADNGAGIFAQLAPEADLTIDSSTLSHNVASASGVGGGLAINDGGAILIRNSTIWGNQANLGGGIFLTGGDDVEILNSTISGNEAGFIGGGIYFGGSNSRLLLRLTTVNDNRAASNGGSVMLGSNSASVQLDHAVVANGIPGDLAGFGLPMALANYSLIEAPGFVTVTGANNLVGVDPLLGPLVANGGPTLTHRPLPGSPVIDAGNPAIPDPPATDQRGSARIVGPTIDLGSVEGGAFVEVPTLSEIGLLALCFMLVAFGISRLRQGSIRVDG